MAKIKARLSELKDADVTFVSLVDRSASRMPFRIIKRDSTSQEQEHMGTVDLTSISRILKSEAANAVVAGFVVFKQDKPEVQTAIEKALTDNGFKVDTVIKNDDGTIIYEQTPNCAEGAVMVRMSEASVVLMKGAGKAAIAQKCAAFSSKVMKAEFLSGLPASFDGMYETTCALVAKGDPDINTKATIKKMAEAFGTYLETIVELVPAAVFKADLAMQEIIEKANEPVVVAKGAQPDIIPASVAFAISKIPAGDLPTTWLTMSGKDQMTWANSWYDSKFANGASAGMVVKAAKKPVVADDPNEADDEATESAEEKDAELAAAKAKAKKVDPVEPDATAVALETITKSLVTLSAQIEAQGKAQQTQQAIVEKTVKTVEGLVAKADDTKNTIVAASRSTEEPSGVVVVKADDDPRRGNFDTGTMRGHRTTKGLFGQRTA